MSIYSSAYTSFYECFYAFSSNVVFNSERFVKFIGVAKLGISYESHIFWKSRYSRKRL